jgi:hypothetical protein
MPLLVACRSPADGTPGARLLPPPCRRTTRRRQRTSEFRSFRLTLALHGALRRTKTMQFLVACRSPAVVTPGARLLPPSCSCTRRICSSFAMTRRRQRTSPLMIARPSSSADGTPGRTTTRIVSLIARPRLRAPTGAPSPTTSLSQAGPAGMECRRRRARHRRPPGPSPTQVPGMTMTQSVTTTRTLTSPTLVSNISLIGFIL